MVFGSVEFLLYFLPIFLILYGITPRSLKNITLLSGSLLFYALGDPKYLFLLLCSMAVNYYVGLYLIDRKKGRQRGYRKRKILLIAAIAGNVGLLALFKFASGRLGFPLGISFYTFQMMSYLIDVYNEEIKREWSFSKFATYVCMFPRLVSGPIVGYGEMEESLRARKFTAAGIQDGLKVFTMGLAAKVLLADRIGYLWNEICTTGFESISTPLAWLGAVAYSMKIYFDFYGYSLMAVGLGRMLGFELPENFREPYMARGVRDFYRRWHITLTGWFRKYVYIPLGGNRRSEPRVILNLLVVWVLTALWHGGTVNFLIWGLSLWLCVVLERMLDRLGIWKRMKVLPRLYLWAVIPVTWMCFEITDLSQLGIYLGRMFGLVKGIRVFRMDFKNALANYGWLLAACFAACTPLVKKAFYKFRDHPAGLVVLGLLFWVCVWRIIVEGGNPFMYSGF